MTRKQRYEKVIEWFAEHQPSPETELFYTNPFELLVAVILSAQCTDKRVNMVTPALLQEYPDAFAMSKAMPEDIFPFIKSISYGNNKAKHLAGMARMIVEDFNGEIPETVDELIKLPGVGRKTANVITSVIWEQPNMAVDTHVFRVGMRIGLVVKAKTPLQAEEQLIKYIPKELVHKAHHWLILHGRYTCIARTPKCAQCGIQAYCQFFEKEMKYVIAGKRDYNPFIDAENKLS